MGSQRDRARTRRVADQDQQDLGHEYRAIIVRYARLDNNGVPIRCAPSRAEKPGRMPAAAIQVASRRDWQLAGNDEKVILRDEAAGWECARELELLDGKARRAYPCPRSKSGHYHTTTLR